MVPSLVTLPARRWDGLRRAYGLRGASEVVHINVDIVLALANDRGVRSALQARQPTYLLHATTSANWQAQVHRHVAGLDDCIDCRIPPEAPRLQCSTSALQSQAGRRADPALPFLSGSAALMLAVLLARLQEESLVGLPYNFAALDLGGPQPRLQRLFLSCREQCRTRVEATF